MGFTEKLFEVEAEKSIGKKVGKVYDEEVLYTRPCITGHPVQRKQMIYLILTLYINIMIIYIERGNMTPYTILRESAKKVIFLMAVPTRPYGPPRA